MNVLRAFKTELDLNNSQKTACAKHAGAARYAYNWGLARKQQAYLAGEKAPSVFDLQHELVILKKTELAWMSEVSKCAPQEALRNLDRAFANFFRRVKQKKTGKNVKTGYPRFKSKRKGLGSFRLRGAIHVVEKSIQLPRLGVLRLKEHGYLPIQDVRILSATVSEKAGRWFVSVQVDQDIPDPETSGKPRAGVDLGINRMAQVSDGMPFDNPHALERSLAKIERLQRTVSRRQKGSANRKKAVKQLAKAYARTANIRKDALHEATTRLTKTKSVIVLENLNVSGMMKNHHLAQAISDVGWYEFRRQMEYKGAWYGCKVVLADRYFPSTKRCSKCGNRKDSMSLDERVYLCGNCGSCMDRDLNAAVNLEQWLYLPEDEQATASSSGSNACGEERSMPGLRTGQVLFAEAGTERQSVLDRFE
jgi:putative transposase